MSGQDEKTKKEREDYYIHSIYVENIYVSAIDVKRKVAPQSDEVSVVSRPPGFFDSDAYY